MSIEDTARFFYIASLCAILIVGIGALIRYKPKKDDSVSLSLAISKRYFLLSALSITVLGTVFFATVLLWLIPYHALHPLSAVITAASYLCMLVVAWVPVNGKNIRMSHRIHFAAGALLGVLFMTLMAYAAVCSPQIPQVGRFIIAASVVYCTICYLLYVFIPISRRYFLLIEVVALVCALACCFILAL